jgi:hypothetical protein
MDGRLAGRGIRYGDGKRNNDCTLEWRENGSGVEWPVRLTAAAHVRVTLQYATATPGDGGTFELRAGSQSLVGVVHPTAQETNYTDDTVGEMDLPAGAYALVVRATEVKGPNLMKLRTLTLSPVK